MYDIKHRLTGETLLSVPVKLRRPRFYGPNLNRAKFPKGVNLENADLRGAELHGVNLEGANLRGADLRCADLSQTRLKGADLEGACLFCATLRGAGLLAVNLRGADLRGADLSFANIYGHMEGADLSGANLSFTDLSDFDNPEYPRECARKATLYGVPVEAWAETAPLIAVDPLLYFMHTVQNFEDLHVSRLSIASGDLPEGAEPLEYSPSKRRENLKAYTAHTLKQFVL